MTLTTQIQRAELLQAAQKRPEDPDYGCVLTREGAELLRMVLMDLDKAEEQVVELEKELEQKQDCLSLLIEEIGGTLPNGFR